VRPLTGRETYTAVLIAVFAGLVGLMWASGNYGNALFGTLILIGVAAFWIRVFLHGLPSASARWWVLTACTAVLALITLGTWVFDGLSTTAVVSTVIVVVWSAILARERLAT
jgi:hypothetical protein